MTSENREGRAGVVMRRAFSHKTAAVPAEFHATGGEIFRQAVSK